ncbi:MAG: radical SAM protein [Firmicutes bacterium]|nr:radical SAM protein [Bacillota bacterium]
MSQKTFHIGNIRPPFHAHSLLLQITENCTWNKCNFCTLYRSGHFKMRSLEEIKEDIDAAAYYRDLIMHRLETSDIQAVQKMASGPSSRLTRDEMLCYSVILNWIAADGMKTVFLQDANSIVVKKDILCEAIKYLKEKFPTVETVSCYGRADTLASVSQKDFAALKEAGLNMIHSGYESGCDDVLKILNKGITRQQQIDAGRKVKEAGITFNMFYMPGSGGRGLSRRNAVETAEVVNAVDPDFLRIRTFVVKSGAPMWEIAYSQDFEECSDMEKLLEIRTMIENLDPALSCYVISDHIINLLPGIEGRVSTDKSKILEYIDNFLALPADRQRAFQLARRMWAPIDYTQLDDLSDQQREKIRDVADHVRSDEDFEKTLRNYLRNYI